MEKPLKRKDLYARLGVEHDASTYDIVRAFKKMGAKLHPNNWIVSTDEIEEKYKAVNEAYVALVNPLKRAVYDRERNAELGLRIVIPSGSYEEVLNDCIKKGRIEYAFKLAQMHKDRQGLLRVIAHIELGIEYSHGKDAARKVSDLKERIISETKTFDQMLSLLASVKANNQTLCP